MPPDGPMAKYDTQAYSGPSVPVDYKLGESVDICDQGWWTGGVVSRIDNADVVVKLLRKYYYYPDENGRYPRGKSYLERSLLIVKNHDLKRNLRKAIVYKLYDRVQLHGTKWIPGNIIRMESDKILIKIENKMDGKYVNSDIQNLITDGREIILSDEQMRNYVRPFSRPREPIEHSDEEMPPEEQPLEDINQTPIPGPLMSRSQCLAPSLYKSRYDVVRPAA